MFLIMILLLFMVIGGGHRALCIGVRLMAQDSLPAIIGETAIAHRSRYGVVSVGEMV